MQDLALSGSADAEKPFFRFVLHAPHDYGTNSIQGCDACFRTARTEHIFEWIGPLPNLAPFKNFSPSSLLNFLPNILEALAITQTAPIETMLTMAVRHFEFRPAKLYPLFKHTSRLRDMHYFNHAFLPGLAFDNFLDEIVQFLDDNQNEIVVIHLRRDGVAKECTSPTTDEINAYLEAACSQASKPLNWTDKMVTILQCQATSTNIRQVVAYSVLSSKASNSPLMAAKAICDQDTLLWCRNNVLKNPGAEKTVVIMNDFFDGGTADTAISLSEQRLAMP